VAAGGVVLTFLFWQAEKATCINNHRQFMTALFTYGTDFDEYPMVLDWGILDAQDLPVNRSGSVSDNQPGGFSFSKDYARFGIPAVILLRQGGYIEEYAVVQCTGRTNDETPYYNRHMNAKTQTFGGYMLSVLSADASLYTIYENGSGTSLAVRNHGTNPFAGLYQDASRRRSTSKRGYSTRDRRPASTFAWTSCPGRFESQNGGGDPARPGSSFGGYGYEPHGPQVLSSTNPVFGGVSWADLWDVGSVHFVDRVIGFADGRAVYDYQEVAHGAGCPRWEP